MVALDLCFKNYPINFLKIKCMCNLIDDLNIHNNNTYCSYLLPYSLIVIKNLINQHINTPIIYSSFK